MSTQPVAGFLYSPRAMDQLVANSSAERLDRASKQAPPRKAQTIRRILVCVDNSSSSEACVQCAADLSRHLGSTITLLHVIEAPREGSAAHDAGAIDWEISREQASTRLGALGRQTTEVSGSVVDTRLEQGHPAERITTLAGELDVDLTVLGSQGERRSPAWSLGSTALQILAATRRSVLVTPPTCSAGRGVPLKRVLVPLDGSSRSESVLPTAVQIAQANDAELLLVFVVREPLPTLVLHAPSDIALARDLAARVESNGQIYLEELGKHLAREGARVRTLVLRSTDEKQSLLDLGRAEPSDLIVLSAHGSTCNPALAFGSVTTHLLTHAAVPLLVLQDLYDSELRAGDHDQRAPPLRASFPPDEV